LNKTPFHDVLKRLSRNALQHMQTIAENLLNPHRYYLSDAAKKRLRWIYVLEHEAEGNVTVAATKIGISRQWLSTLNAVFQRNRRDPRSLEPQSRAPHHTDKRTRISNEVEDKIVQVRKGTPGWGKEKIARLLQRDHGIKVSPSTANRYMKKHHLINPRLADKNAKAWAQKKLRDQTAIDQPILKVKHRPPKQLKDYAPGALIEKDMKFIVKQGQFVNTAKYKAKENFYYQHTMIDSFTRMRVLALVKDSESATAARAHSNALQRFPFPVACENTDNGSENNGAFSQELAAQEVFQFYSSVGTPTDNPRVERSHLTDDKEFYLRGNMFLPFKEQSAQLLKWEQRYNDDRPHQALAYLTPMEFYQLWKRSPEEAYAISRKWQHYLARQRKRMYAARRIKSKEQVKNLMQFIDAKLNKKVELQTAKQTLINCQLCSWT
jgi:transposase InsO family protein